MKKQKYKYLINIQFMGFRYHGFQKQKDILTVQEAIELSISKAYPEFSFKISGGSRTDSMVSAMDYILFLVVEDFQIKEREVFLKRLNDYLPQDIRALKIDSAPAKFNVINSPKLKEYHYYFCYGEKPHPLVASFMCSIKGHLDIEKMTLAAKYFEGTHNFRQYCYKPHEQKELTRTIELCELQINSNYVGNFIPKESYFLKVKAKSFMRYQIRIMMGAIFKVGLGELTLDEIQDSLLGKSENIIGFIAPGSGLILQKVEYEP